MMKDNEVMRKNDKAMKKIGKAMIKNGLIFGVLIILTTLNAWSQDTIRVLAIGNSFSVDAVKTIYLSWDKNKGSPLSSVTYISEAVRLRGIGKRAKQQGRLFVSQDR